MRLWEAIPGAARRLACHNAPHPRSLEDSELRPCLASLLALTTLVVVAARPAQAAPYPASPELKAKAACVVDGESGQVLLDMAAHERRAMASTTKIMTSLLAVESGRLDEYVPISRNAAMVGEASISLKPGERITLRELTYGVLLSSGNDASTAVAEFLGGGTVAGFVVKMNERVRAMGLRDTHFANPHGLPGGNHYSSAYDLSMMLREASRLPQWRSIAEARWHTVSHPSRPEGRLLRNHNKTLWDYPGAGPGKTGFTNAAGRCFVGSARQNGREVFECVLASGDLWGDTHKLLTFGLSQFETVTLAKQGEVVGSVPVRAGYNRSVEVVAPGDVRVSVPKGTANGAMLQQDVQLPEELPAPVDDRQAVGQLIVRQDARVLMSMPLVAAQAVPLASGAWVNLGAWVFPGSLAFAALGLVRWRELRRRARLRRRAQRLPGRKHSPLVAPRAQQVRAVAPQDDARWAAVGAPQRLKRPQRRPN